MRALYLKILFPVQLDNMEHAIGLIGVYHTGEYSSFVRTCRVYLAVVHGGIYTWEVRYYTCIHY